MSITHEMGPADPSDTIDSDGGERFDYDSDRWMRFVWLTVGVTTFGLAAALAYRPSFDSPGGVLLAALPPVVLVSMTTVFLDGLIDLRSSIRTTATMVSIAAWAVLLFNDDRWSILTFALYAVCFEFGPIRGVMLAGLVSVAWAGAYVAEGAPLWIVVIPTGVFFVGSLISATIYRADRLNTEQADLIRQLQDTRRELADSERSKGMLQERARFAAEIHDTLAQGFTSIVLLSRAAMRNQEMAEGLASIEETALENLAAARRLVDAEQPPELDSATLPDALDRQIAGSLPAGISSRFRVVGRPRRLNGAIEVTLLRATQEALLNIRSHANALNVDVTLSYLDDLVALDVRDDGVGFDPGTVNDRGPLTGGQGLKVLEQRAQSLAGELTIEAMEDGGSVLSILLPAAGR